VSGFWTLWLIGLLAIFALGEGYALRQGKLTLSRFVWQASQGPEGWPPLLVIYGIVLGGLAVHFWWHWCPAGLGGQGG